MMKTEKLKKSFVKRLIIALVAIFVCMSTFVTIYFHSWISSEISSELRNMVTDIESEFIYYEYLPLKNGDGDTSRELLKLSALHNCSMYRYQSIFQKYSNDNKLNIFICKTIQEKYPDGSYSESYEPVCIPFNFLIARYYLNDNTNYERNMQRTSGEMIIMLDDICTPDQISSIRNLNRGKEKELYLSVTEGYLYGRFFYPTKMTLEYGDNSIEILTGYEDTSGNLISMEVVSPQICFSDGTALGDIYDMTTLKDAKNIMKNHFDDLFPIPSDNEYNTVVSLDNFYYGYVVKELSVFYVVFLLLLFLAGLVLINEYDNIVGFGFRHELKRRNMMNALAHDMKTPLAVVRNYCEVLLEKSSDARQSAILNKIINESEKLNSSIVDVLDLSKMEAGVYPMELSSVSVSEMLESLLNDGTVLFDKKNLNVEVEVDDNQRVLVDERLIESIFLNLISNAVKHTPHSGKITIRVASRNDEVRFHVRNQGSRIGRVEGAKIWEPYYGNKLNDRQSNGLGLAIVRNACLMHNGNCGFTNEEDGVTFWTICKSMENSVEDVRGRANRVIKQSEHRHLGGILKYIIGCSTAVLSLVCLLFVNQYSNGLEVGLYKYLPLTMLLISAVLVFFGEKQIDVDLFSSKKNKVLSRVYVVNIIGLYICEFVLYDYELWHFMAVLAGFILLMMACNLFDNCAKLTLIGDARRDFVKLSLCKTLYIFAFVLLIISYGVEIFVIESMVPEDRYLALYSFVATIVEVIIPIVFCLMQIIAMILWIRAYTLSGKLDVLNQAVSVEDDLNEIKRQNINKCKKFICNWLSSNRWGPIICLGMIVMSIGHNGDFSFNYMMWPGYWIMPIGAGLICFGIKKMYRQQEVGKNFLILAHINLIVSIMFLAYGAWSEFSAYYSTLIGFTVEIIQYISIFMVAVTLFVRNIKNARERGTSKDQIRVKRSMTVYVCLYIFAMLFADVLFFSNFEYVYADLGIRYCCLLLIPNLYGCYCWLREENKLRNY